MHDIAAMRLSLPSLCMQFSIGEELVTRFLKTRNFSIIKIISTGHAVLLATVIRYIISERHEIWLQRLFKRLSVLMHGLFWED